MPDLLIELFSEEIPARMQTRAADDLKRLVTGGLVETGLTYASAGAFSTPRRLVLAVEGLTAESRAVREERKGPALDANPKALSGYLRGLGLEAPPIWYEERIEHLRAGGVIESEGLLVRTTEVKGKEVLLAIQEYLPRPAAKIVAEVLEAAIRSFPWPKSMRWGSGNLRWVRPLHSILCLLTDEHGAEVVPLTVDHLTAGNTTEGHRFMAPGRFAVTGFDDYRAKLRRSFVVLDAGEREAAIRADAETLAFARGLELVPDAGLLAEVAGLVEWPVALLGDIGKAFLDLPPEVLQTSMREHQKFFSVRNPKTARIEGFVTVANRETADQGATILSGNLKVLSARLSDAKFFWENDLRVVKAEGLEGMGAGLASVTFHNKLGSQADRVARIAALAREIASLVGADPDLAEQAAKVAKADLQSAMVGEFPELQGTMGGYYARAAGLPEAVANACKAHYSPLGPGDEVPSEPVSVAVALADKIDTLCGFWAIDEKPTGSKDPFALRRAALGVIRLVVGNGFRTEVRSLAYTGFGLLASSEVGKKELVNSGYVTRILNALGLDIKDYVQQQIVLSDVVELVQKKFSDLRKAPTENIEDDFWKLTDGRDARENITGSFDLLSDDVESLLAFLHDRLKVHLRDEGIRHDIIDACLAMPNNDDLTLLVHRARALNTFIQSDDGPNLLQGFKRANTLLTQAEAKDGVEYSYGADPKFAETDEERALFTALDHAEAAIAPAMKDEDFAAAMAALAQLRAPIDAFFETVQVHSDNTITRRNRLNLLHRIRAACAPVADLTRIEG